MQLISVSKRARRHPYDRHTPHQRAAWQEYNAKPRIYISHDGEGVLANLANRTSRPIAMYRQLLPAALKLMGLPADTKVRWSKHAGCTMCPCSPGFILEDAPYSGRWDAWMTVSGDLIDTHDPQAVARAEHRARQILADPTLVPQGA